MEVVIVEDEAAAAKLVADAIEALLHQTTAPVLGLATGSSPAGVYDELIARHRHAGLSFARCSAFLLDEYVALPSDHPASCRAVIARTFTGSVDFPPGAVRGLDGTASDPVRECAEYEHAIASKGGVDLQLLGIGANGHIAFNEPSSSLGSRTRIKVLAERSRLDNSRFFAATEDVPRQVLTQGIGTILEAGRLIVLAFGAAKAAPIAAAVEGPITAMVPASAIQLHPHVTVIVDEVAAGELTLADYYRAAFTLKPTWPGI